MDALYGVPLERGKCAGCCMRLVFGVAHGTIVACSRPGSRIKLLFNTQSPMSELEDLVLFLFCFLIFNINI